EDEQGDRRELEEEEAEPAQRRTVSTQEPHAVDAHHVLASRVVAAARREVRVVRAHESADEQDAPPRSPRAQAEVDVLVVREEFGVEITDGLEHLAPHEHRATRYVVDVVLGVPALVVRTTVSLETTQVLTPRERAPRRPDTPLG